METKRCTTCGADKAHSEFYKSKKSADGLRYQCKACAIEQRETWRAENPDSYKEQRKRGRNSRKVRGVTPVKKYTTKGSIDRDIRFFLNAEMRCLIRYGKSINEVLGFEARDVMAHLEPKFTDGMSWDNYKISGWHIDHVTPLCSISYSSMDSDSFRSAWSLDNLQPLWAEDNQAKGSKIELSNAT